MTTEQSNAVKRVDAVQILAIRWLCPECGEENVMADHSQPVKFCIECGCRVKLRTVYFANGARTVFE